MKGLFYPQSVMVVGVSNSAMNMGRIIVENLDRFDFEGEIYPVGRDGGSINGRRIFTQIEEVDAVPELAVFLIPARFVPAGLDACGKKGIRYAVIETGGFNEFGDEASSLVDELLRVAHRWNIRFVGPNCISIINLENGLVLPFVPINRSLAKSGAISLVAQSGGVIVDSTRLCSLENVGFNKMVSIGNKLDLNENDYLEYLIGDPGTGVIGLYLENIVNGRKLCDLARRTDKPVIILKSNTNLSSRRIASFHTAALAGDDAVADAAFRQCGIIRVGNIHEMIDAFKAFSMPSLKGNRLGILCRSGGQAVLSVDAAHRNGFEMASFTEDFFRLAREKARAGVIRMTNPLDLGDVFDIYAYTDILEMALREEGVDGVVVNHQYMRDLEREPTERFLRAAREFSSRFNKPVVFCMLSEKEDWFTVRHSVDYPVFAEPDYALKALRLSRDRYQNRGGLRTCFPSTEVRNADAVISPGIMETYGAFELLRSYGVTVAEYRIAESIEDAREKAEEIGYPVALKVSSREVLHKTEVGGIVLNIQGPDGLIAAAKGMGKGNYLVQKMIPAGQEVIIGGKRDPEFGPVVLFGLGGVFVELLKDVVLRVAPVGEDEAEKMMREISGALALEGFRGEPPRDKEALRECIVNVSRMLAEHPEITNLDINPVIVGEKGMGCCAVDVVVEAGEHECSEEH